MSRLVQLSRRVARRVERRLERSERRADHELFDRFNDFTMISRPRYLDNLEIARRAAGLTGAVVECGVWRGGMIAGIASVLGPQRPYVLFDSFEGLPPAQDIDGRSALDWQANKVGPLYYDNCRAERSFAEQAMNVAGVPHARIEQGWFSDTVAPWAAAGDPIAVLRLDGDWYESTLVCLQHLFPLVVSGGVVLIDDYGTWDGCTRAVHRYLADNERPEPIERLPSQVAYVIKR